MLEHTNDAQCPACLAAFQRAVEETRQDRLNGVSCADSVHAAATAINEQALHAGRRAWKEIPNRLTRSAFGLVRVHIKAGYPLDDVLGACQEIEFGGREIP